MSQILETLSLIILVLASCDSATINAGFQNSYHMRQEIQGYKDVADSIIKFATKGEAKGQTFQRLATMVDKFGPRVSGSKNLEDAIDYMLDVMNKDGLDNVHGEPAKVPHWVRGKENATLLLPRLHEMSILGLGSSIATPPSGISAEAIVVRSFDELHKRAAEASGKIVVFNQEFVSYGISVAYRAKGASEAAKVGAVASLIRSVTPLSINSPHTGWQDYENGVKKIPTACITVEDAEMLNRMAERGEKIVIKLYMEATNYPPVMSRNTVAEIKGSKYPEQVVLVSGHLDSWDVGQGAMDDGGGAFISWQALSIIRQMGLKPKRTMRAVLWTAEEPGLVGSQQYFEMHKANISNFDIVMESDIGTFAPVGLTFSGSAAAYKVMKEVSKLLAPVNATALKDSGAEGDINPWIKAGVPGSTLMNQNDRYFYFHHTNGDTMTVQNSTNLDACAAVWAVASFVVADMDNMLPRA